MPFFSENSNFLFSMILNQNIKYPKNKTNVSNDAKSLILALLQKNPKDRIGNYFKDPKNERKPLGAD